MRIILPCAGHGARFRDAGYTVDKPLIEVNGKTLLEWALEPVPKDWQKIFITRDDQHMDVHREAKRHGFRLVLPGSTRGAAMTVLSAAVGLPPDEPVACMNVDQVFDVDLEKVVAQAMAENWSGFILTFGEDGPWPGPAWSYAVTDGTTHVISVVEKPKEPIAHSAATVGFYWWRRAGDLVRCICKMIGDGHTVNGEFYLAPSYEFLPLSGCVVHAVPVKWFQGLGTPEQVKNFMRNFVGLGTPAQVKSFEQAALVREP